MNAILVYAKTDVTEKTIVGVYDDIENIENKVAADLIKKKLTEYSNNCYLVMGVETFRMKFPEPNQTLIDLF